MALLFMLHLRSAFNHEWLTFSDGRLSILRRFAHWIDCSCHCGGQWNFANDTGIIRIPGGKSEHHKCIALGFTQAGKLQRKMSVKGKQIDTENRKAWLS
jgi:hypothetical protein